MEALFDEALVVEFVTESREHLDGIEPDLLALEEDANSATPEVVNRIFRAIHSIKGGAGFLAYEALKRLSHEMESALMRVRDGESKITPALTDVLLRSVDKLRVMLDDLESCDNVPCQAEIADLEALMSGGAPCAAAAVVPQVGGESVEQRLGHFDWTGPVLSALLRKTSPVYLVQIVPDVDIVGAGRSAEEFLRNLTTLGTVALPSDADELATLIVREKAFDLVFGTVLEEDLAPTALEIAAERVTLLQPEVLRAAAAAPQSTAENVPTEGTATTPTEGDAPKAGKSPARGDTNETLRVRLDLVSSLMNSAGELVLTRNQMFKALETHLEGHTALAAALQKMDRVTTEIQDAVMRTRLQPIGAVLGKFPRVVRDVARMLHKEIDVELEGTEVEVDRSVIELIGDPLTHIIRNCADHAIETPEQRQLAGKERRGRIEIKAAYEGGQVVVLVKDNGRGIDPEKIRGAAVKKGVITEEQSRRMSTSELTNLIFAPGFSTAEKITDVSGRGVGMDVVRTNIEKLGGSVEVQSKIGEGTTVSLHIPLTLAIVPALLVGVEDAQFAVPQVAVEELVWIKAADARKHIERVQNVEVLRLRDSLLPLLNLADILEMQRTFIHPETGERKPDKRARFSDRRGDQTEVDFERRDDDRRQHWQTDYRIVVVRTGRIRYGLVVSHLIDSEDIVMKPLSRHLRDSRCFSGSTITGDGRVITVLDVAAVAAVANLQASSDDLREEEQARRSSHSIQMESVVLFRYAPGETFAVAQKDLLRLDRIELDTIQQVGGKSTITYRGRPLPILRLDETLNVGGFPAARRNGYLLVPKPQGGASAAPSCGVLVSEILDTVELDMDLHASPLAGPGVLGSSIHNDQIVTLLEPTGLAERASRN